MVCKELCIYIGEYYGQNDRLKTSHKSGPFITIQDGEKWERVVFLEPREKRFAGTRAWIRLSALWVAKELFLDDLRQKESIRCRNSSERVL